MYINNLMHKENFPPSNSDILKGFNFLLNHFNQERLFPRTIMTKKLGFQKEVFSKEEAFKLFQESEFIDCRINAFPAFTEYKGIQRYPPDFIFIDLDKNNFKKTNNFESALSITLKNIKKIFDGTPTVLWTGNGYHIYQPLESFALEETEIFSEFEKPSIQFLRFAKDYVSNYKADRANNPSFKSCLLRIPFSFNSKYLISNERNTDYQIKIIQEWNGKRPSIKYILREFRRYLIDRKLREIKRKQISTKYKFSKYDNQNNNNKDTVLWIEKLLKMSIADFRKNSISLILTPYLVNIRNLKYQESFDILIEWLEGCNSFKRLDFSPNYLVKHALNTAIEKKIPPMKLDTLKEKNPDLYLKLK